ncbi:palmitoyl-CoA hydrolase [Lentimicrobium sp. S6]|nr:palmitoyl-CoA hydrolase [Lentimicrobium sp. S6]
MSFMAQEPVFNTDDKDNSIGGSIGDLTEKQEVVLKLIIDDNKISYRTIANKSYVGLSLPYTRLEGLLDLPEEIPLEYFEKAIDWLGQQAEVDPKKIIVMGASRNAELALVLASMLPNKISGVIAYAPSSVSWANRVLPYNSDHLKASWTYKGEDIPYIPMEKITPNTSSEINTLAYWKSGLEKTEVRELASIKVENINGPILLFSGKEDGVWPAAQMADSIEKRIKAHGFKYPFYNIQYENAGHLISRNPDSDTDVSTRIGQMNIKGKNYDFEYGGSMDGDNQAKKLARLKLFEFLATL